MNRGFTVVVATHGDKKWEQLAQRRAVPSAQRQGVPVEYVHGGSLHEARNEGLERVQTEFVVFLDADDELSPGYIDAMARGSADLRGPWIRWVTHTLRRAKPPFQPRVYGHTHDCTGECLPHGNYLGIGTAARVELLRDVGGFQDWPIAEDWALWSRCYQAGATIELIPGAVYRLTERKGSRNFAHTGEWRNARRDEMRAVLWPTGSVRPTA